MKKLFALIAFIVCAVLPAVAQADLQDVVYLKNGSVIRGIIIEQIPGNSLKLALPDGNVFSISFATVEKMTREGKILSSQTFATSEGSQISFPMTRSERRAAAYADTRNAHYRGYRGNLELLLPVISSDDEGTGIGVSTTHGYQFNPHLFVGGGMAFYGYPDDSDTGFYYDYGYMDAYLCLFSDIKCYVFNRKVSPFVDFQLGISEGIYCAGSVGCSLSLNRILALNLSVGFVNPDLDFYDSIPEAVAFRFALDF